MKANPWLAGLVILALTLLGVSVCRGNADASDHAEAARSYANELDARDAIEQAAEATAAQQDTLVAELRASLESERNDRVAERAQTDLRIANARETGTVALDSARANASESVGRYLDAHEAEDSVMIAGYESKITSLEADTVALSLELVETRRQALFNRRGWDVADESLRIAMLRGDEWEAAYVAQRRKGLLTNVGSGVLLVVALVMR